MLAALAFAFTGLAAAVADETEEAPPWPDWERFRLIRTLDGPIAAWRDVIKASPGGDRWALRELGLEPRLREQLQQAKSLEALIPLLQEFAWMNFALQNDGTVWPYGLRKDIAKFAEAPYGIETTVGINSLKLSGRAPDGSRRRITRMEERETVADLPADSPLLDAKTFSIFSWDSRRILVANHETGWDNNHEQTLALMIEIHPQELIVSPEAIVNGLHWADLPSADQVTLAKFISQDMTEKDKADAIKNYGKPEHGLPPGFRWASSPEGVIIPPGIDDRRGVIVANCDEGSWHEAILNELRGKTKPKWQRSSEGKLWGFQFGMYSPDEILVWTNDDDMSAALEIAAEWAKANTPGIFTEPDYKEAAEDLGIPWPIGETGGDETGDDETEGDEAEDVEKLSTEEQWEQVRDAAEADLTYTESGHISSDEWHAHEVDDVMVMRWTVLQDPDVIEKILYGDDEDED